MARPGIARRTVLGALGAAAAWPGVRGARAADSTQLAISLRSLANPYHAEFARGGQDFARTVGLPIEVLTTEGDSAKGIADVRTLLARTGGNLVLCIDPNDSADARVIVEDVTRAGGQVVTVWNKPADLHPWDFGHHYVAHLRFDGVLHGRQMATALFEAMGGTGGIVALGGIAGNIPAIDRKAGLLQAVEAAGGAIRLLDFQVADWAAPEATRITAAWLARFGDALAGIWAANDEMAAGAIATLRAAGLAGKIPVTGMDGTAAAVAATRSGEMVGTVDWNPRWLGGMGLAVGYHTRIGKIAIEKQPKPSREMFGSGVPVTRAVVDSFVERAANPAPIDYDTFWGRPRDRSR